jgi:hypothetical protein
MRVSSFAILRTACGTVLDYEQLPFGAPSDLGIQEAHKP